MRVVLFLLFLCPGLAFAAVSNTATTSRDSVSLVSATNAAQNGGITLALNFNLKPGWHIYWSNPGDAGLPPQIVLDAPATAGPFTYPPPEYLLQDSVAAYVLSGHVVIAFHAAGVTNNITAIVNWLVCSNVCVPEHAHFALPLAGGASAEAALFQPSAIVPSPFAASIAPDGTLALVGPGAGQIAAAHFFPASPNQIINAAAQPISFANNDLLLHLSLAPGFDKTKPFTGILELTDRSRNMQALSIAATPGPAAAAPFILWLAFAFLGGLILNLMPCVFPVLAMKALSLARLGNAARAKIRREALAYTAGVLTAMAVIAAILLSLRAFGAAIGWGFQLQSPIFVALMALLVLAIALNLAGIFSINGNFGNRLAAQGSFLTGLLAVVVATPCTAPFMGGAIAAALIAPLPAAAGIFIALGLGLAAPFLLIAIIPAIASLLPRPGAWMALLQRLLSLPMFATFFWLGWVFISQLSAAPALTLPNAEPYSAPRLAAYRAAGQPVFVDMTAAWCITCLVNDRTTLTSPDVQKTFAATHTKTLLGDWTSRDPAITNFLQQNNRDGVPLYVYYPANAQPITLPQILTPAAIKAVLR